jgi:hypothetical protein
MEEKINLGVHVLADLYNDTFDLYSYSQTGRNDLGGVERALVEKQMGIACYQTEIDEDELFQYGKLQVVATHRIFCNLLSDIASSDKIYLHGPALWMDILFIDNCNAQNDHLEIAVLTIKAPEVLP